MASPVEFVEVDELGVGLLGPAARGVAGPIGATYLRIDTIESAIVSTLMPFRDNPVGYVVAGQVAADQLADGRDVVADAVNGVAAARAGWMALAARASAVVQFVEVRCSDVAEHRRRVEARGPEMPGQGVPGWTQVLQRRYEPWLPELSGRLVVGTSAMRRGVSRTLSPGSPRGNRISPHSHGFPDL